MGRRLAAAILSQARRRSALRVRASARADRPRALAFLDQQGFREKRRVWSSRLLVAEAVEPSDRSEPLPREGIMLTTLAEEGPELPEVRHRPYELVAEVSVDLPRLGR